MEFIVVADPCYLKNAGGRQAYARLTCTLNETAKPDQLPLLPSPPPGSSACRTATHDFIHDVEEPQIADRHHNQTDHGGPTDDEREKQHDDDVT